MKHVLVSIFTLWASFCVTNAQSSLSTSLPMFRTADPLNGQTIQELSDFIPTNADYTLDISAKAGVPVEIRFGRLSYVPVTDGRVRFVQQGGQVYVFENNTYVTTLTPVYTYQEQGEQLLRNPSFEQVTEQLGEGRWKAADWETWNGGTPTWGGDVYYVNVRENADFRSDGTKSIILHSYSRWLSQQLGESSLQPHTAYLLTYDYWTSNGSDNGGITYRLQLGNGVGNNNIMDVEGHTTERDRHDKCSFSTIFQTPFTLPDDLYFSFFRSESKVDWLDNLKLVRIQPESAGISGTENAVYTTGAFAPANMNLPEGTYIDYTGQLVNPSFDNGTMTDNAPQGWTLDAPVTQSKISTVGKGNGTIDDQQNHWQLWQSNGALSGQAHQTVEGLPNGKYRISVQTVCTDFTGNISLYANYGKTDVRPNSAQTCQVTGIVVDGHLDFGFNFATTSGMTIDFDSFTLHYLGMDTDGYREVLTIKIKEARDILNHPEEGFDTTALNNAITAAEALTEEAPAEEIIAAIADIEHAVEDYQQYADEKKAERERIARYDALITEARNELATEQYPGYDAFLQAIADADAVDRTGDLTAAADALNAARETYYNSQYTLAPVQQTVSYVDCTLNESEKYVLRIDGKPFYATEIQVRPDKLRGYEGWNEEEVEAVFKRAADDGFSTLSVPVYWSEVEPEKNHFDWRMLDKYLNWCKKYNLKMELLWFSWSSGGRIQYLWNYNGRQQLRTPDYVCSLDGKSEFNMLRTNWEYSLDWRDTPLRDRETFVLGRIMEHVALWDTNNNRPHTLIGVQLGNEACTHGANTATDEEIISWYHHVGAAVKQSKYVVWTRLNCISWMTSGRTRANEKLRNEGGTNIDFVGIDIYGTNASKVKGDMDGQLGTQGKNYRMIMEIDAKDANSPIYQLAALAGDKAFDYYNMGHVDGNGLYGNNGHTLAERGHIRLVRQRNKIINADVQDIALKSHGKGLYVYNHAGNSTAAETGILGISFTPDNAQSQAISIERSSNEIVLMTTAGGRFTYPTSLNIQKTERGYFDNGNRWIKEGDITFSSTAVTLPEATCARLIRGNISDENEWLRNGEFETDLNHWYKTFEAHTYKVSTQAKGDGSVIKGGEGHMQLWNDRSISGRIYQDITLPDGTYTLRAGIYAEFKGNVELYANQERTPVISGQNAWYEVTATVTDGHLQVGLNLQTDGTTDIELDHITLTENTGNGISRLPETKSHVLDIYDLNGRKVPAISRMQKGIYIINRKKVIQPIN